LRKQAPGFSLRFWSLVAATFLGFLGMGTVLPGLAPHIRHDLGGSDRTVGFAIGIFSFMALASRFFSGPLADRRGRKIAFLAGLFSCGLAGGAYLLPLGIPGACLGRTLQGFGEACLYTGAAAWAVEIAGVERSSQALGYISSGIWGGISAGPVVGQWLGSFERAAAMQVITVALAILLLTFVPESYTPSGHPRQGPWLPRAIIAPGLAIGFVNVAFPVITGFLVLHLASHGNGGPGAFTAYAGVVLVSRFFLGGVPDRINPRITYYFGISAMAAGLLMLASGPSPLLAIASAALLGFGFSFPWSSIIGSVLKKTPASEHGRTVGFLSAFYDLFVGMSSFAAGEVASRFGYPSVFVMAACALVVAGALGWLVFPHAPALRAAADDEAYLEPVEF
jgi:MFS family permease